MSNNADVVKTLQTYNVHPADDGIHVSTTPHISYHSETKRVLRRQLSNGPKS